MKKTKKKLSLSKETVRELVRDDLRRADGGNGGCFSRGANCGYTDGPACTMFCSLIQP